MPGTGEPMGEALEIRRATAGDREAAVRLLAAQLAEHDIPAPRPQLEKAIDGMLAREERGAILLALRDGAPIGLAVMSQTWTVEHGGTAMWLDELYIEPAHRGGGIGARLLDAVVAEAQRRGARALDLEVTADHARAANLYARRGFQRHDRVRWVLRLT
ncbi:MAG: GNAT family N-acetyltransferase [bacterium]|nr:GNAT family N-acetyltransferase [bacterium]